ncbi:MAG: sulfatase-like hydrolase/transferase [bacterium]
MASNKTMDYYQVFYKNFINESITSRAKTITQWQNKKNLPLPSYLDNIIILQLESFSDKMVNSTTTPNFWNFAKENVYFPKFISNNVQTILAQENILCSVPGSFRSKLSDDDSEKKLFCLPAILKNAGYRTLFFQDLELSFADTGKFMSGSGFDEVHGPEIAKAGDPKLLWGYQEDIFYKRVFDFIANNNSTNTRNFIYIAISATNHWPFKLSANKEMETPFIQPKTPFDQLVDTTYLQDKYLGSALEQIKEKFPTENYTLIILGDHSVPFGFGLHENSKANWGYYQDGFVTSMAIKVGKEKTYQHQIISDAYSQMDIMPSIAYLFGITTTESVWSGSFWQKNNPNKKIIMIQPFADRYLNILLPNEKQKIQYDFFENHLNKNGVDDNFNETTENTFDHNSSLIELKKYLN